MDIIDEKGEKHIVTSGKKILVDDNVIAHAARHHSNVTLEGFAIPPQLQGRSIGSILIHHLEQEYAKHGVTKLHVRIPIKDCPIHAHFWAKHGYIQHHDIWTKTLQ